MKTILPCCLLAAVFFVGCTRDRHTPTGIEGAWNSVYLKVVAGDTIKGIFPGNLSESELKVWSRSHFAFVGWIKVDSVRRSNYGAGTYELHGNRYYETYLYHGQFQNGQTIKMNFELKEDTLIQTWPLDENGKIDSANYCVEKYMRYKE